MINIERYIKEAMYEFDFFIVPGLGAFIANFTLPEMTRDGEIELPKKTFEFNGLLRKDTDKRFSDFISRNEKYADSTVLESVQTFLKAKRESLQNNSKEVIADVMTLRLNAQGLFEGEINSEINFYEKGVELKKGELLEEKNKITEVTAEEKPLAIPSELMYSNGPEHESTEMAADEELRGEPDRPLMGLKQEKTGGSLADALETEEIEPFEDETENGYRPWLTALWVILGMLLLFLAFYYYSKIKNRPANQSPDETTAMLTVSDTLVQQEQDRIQADLAVDSSNNEGDGYKYEVSAGYFKQKSNADNLLGKLKEAGFNAEIKQLNKRYRVFVGVQTEEAAETMSQEIEQFTGLKSVYFDENGNSSN